MEKTYELRNIYLAVTLLTWGMELIEIKTPEPGDKRRVFVFKDIPERPELVRKYWNNEGSVAPKVLFDTMRQLRDRLFAENN